MPKILAIETATDACSVALSIDGNIQAKYQLSPPQKSQTALPMIDALMATSEYQVNQLDAIAVSQGPGSFSGVRIAIGLAQGIAWAYDLPVILVSTLAIVAQGVWRRQNYSKVAVAIDARMNEVYWGNYQLSKQDENIMVLVDQELVKQPQLLKLESHDWFGAGTGWVYAENLPNIPYNAQCYPHAYDLAVLAQKAWQQQHYVSAEQALPVYLRDKVV